MAHTPLTIHVPLKGTVIVRFENGAEVEVGDIVYNADVNVEIGLAPERYTWESARKTPFDLNMRIG